MRLLFEERYVTRHSDERLRLCNVHKSASKRVLRTILLRTRTEECAGGHLRAAHTNEGKNENVAGKTEENRDRETKRNNRNFL